MKKLEGHTDCVNTVGWCPDGKLLVSGSKDKSIRVWDVMKSREVKKLDGHTSYVSSVSWSPDGNLIASGADDKFIRVWERPHKEWENVEQESDGLKPEYSLILGRQQAGMPPFKVYGQLGLRSRENLLLSDYMFKNVEHLRKCSTSNPKPRSPTMIRKMCSIVCCFSGKNTID
mmetsp:Transcript_388/g.737  ORF Transcript_388/g.737 Transcript_388/m.737 type:complete len:173 (+) Transcript_388:618-1136(+)